MKEARTHFEQVPKAVVEKVLAQLATSSEKEPAENGAVANPAVRKARCWPMRSRKM
jgi:hypothetical protein